MKNITTAILAIIITVSAGIAGAQNIYDNANNGVQPDPYNTPVDNFNTTQTTPISWMQDNSSNALMVYPNPAVNSTRIVLTEPAVNEVYVDLINMNGSLIGSFQFSPGSYQLDLDLGNIPVGLYNAHISSNGAMPQSVKILKH